METLHRGMSRKIQTSQGSRSLNMFAELREGLVEILRERGIHNASVLRAIGTVPREKFLDVHLEPRAYEDFALPIGAGQTISQPFTVAFMSQVLELKPGEKVLEIGTGSGYQTAILAEMGCKVYTIERHIELLETARKRLEKLGYTVISRAGDGSRGWADYAPYDAIIVTAGAPDVPESLTRQLNPAGGRLLIPVGDRSSQKMYLVRRNGEVLTGEELSDFSFVPLIGKEGWTGA
jgi:protein-L-isoaspartate(D-aspartate) O-methyltransferase